MCRTHSPRSRSTTSSAFSSARRGRRRSRPTRGRGSLPGGYFYLVMAPGGGGPASPTAIRQAAAAAPTVLRSWRKRQLPAVRATCEALQQLDYGEMSLVTLASRLPVLFDTAGAAFARTLLIAPAMFASSLPFIEFCAPRVRRRGRAAVGADDARLRQRVRRSGDRTVGGGGGGAHPARGREGARRCRPEGRRGQPARRTRRQDLRQGAQRLPRRLRAAAGLLVSSSRVRRGARTRAERWTPCAASSAARRPARARPTRGRRGSGDRPCARRERG